MQPVIYFDWDGTLADSMPICIGECRMALKALGLPDLPDETIRLCNGPTNEEGCDILHVPEAMREEFLNLRQTSGLSLVPTLQRLFPGVRDMLETLRHSARLAIVSNGMSEYLEKSLHTLHLEGVFERVQGHIPGRTKAELLGDMLRDMRPERAIMVGDRLGDILSGKANGLPTVAACFGYGDESEYAQADLRADTPEALKALLEGWAKG